MKKVEIMDLINMPFEDHYTQIFNIIKADPGYRKSQEEYLKIINSLDTKNKLGIDSATAYMEAIVKDTAFNEGFKLGVRLILNCISDNTTPSKPKADLNSITKDKRFVQAWDRMADAHNNLVDLLIAHNINAEAAVKAVEDLEDSVENYADALTKIKLYG